MSDIHLLESDVEGIRLEVSIVVEINNVTFKVIALSSRAGENRVSEEYSVTVF
jgi:hypothetical protein